MKEVRKIIRNILNENIRAEIALAVKILTVFISSETPVGVNLEHFNLDGMNFRRKGDTDSKKGMCDITFKFPGYDVTLFGEFTVYGTATSSEEAQTMEYPGAPAEVSYDVDVQWTGFFAHPVDNSISIEKGEKDMPALFHMIPPGMEFSVIAKMKKLIEDKIFE
jgi:hypothetical protein